MEEQEGPGVALARLRSIRGLSLEECAQKAGVSLEALRAVEKGDDLELEVLRSVLRLHSLHEAQFLQGFVSDVSDVEDAAASVFLFQGTYQDFDTRDLAALSRAMRAARVLTAHALEKSGGSSAARRLEFLPVPPAGPNPRDAA